MKSRHKLLPLIPLLLFVSSCDERYMPHGESTIAVEGWIEDEGYPVVILTRSMPVSGEGIDIENLQDYIIKWAKVTVSDGDSSVILTGKYQRGYIPPYIYTTGRFKGRAGKKYALTVEYGDFTATAETVIPAGNSSFDYKVQPCENNDTLYQVTASFHNDVNFKNYYQFFTLTGYENRQYLASIFGSINGEEFGDSIVVPVYRGTDISDISDSGPYFRIGDTVSVKLANVNKQAHDFWSRYTESEQLSGSAFFSYASNPEGNINGGTGYWFGYKTSSVYFIVGKTAAGSSTTSSILPAW